MKMLKYIFSGFLCLVVSAATAQNFYSDFAREAVLFSQSSVSGTARTSAFGGAAYSLGGDISSISANPAGLGFYNRSSFSITPVMRFGVFRAENDLNNTVSAGLNVQLPNMGMAIQKRFDQENGWISGTFGIAFNQDAYFYNNYRSSFIIESIDGNIPQDFVEYALLPVWHENYNSGSNGEPGAPFTSSSAARDAAYSDIFADFAFSEDLLQIYGSNGEYYLDRYDLQNGVYVTDAVRREEQIDERGGLTNLDVSYGANYKDILFLGAGLNLGFLNYEKSTLITETPNNNFIDYYEIEENRVLSGVGAGITLGAIFKPVQYLNIALNYKSPQVISIEETQTLRFDAYGNGISGLEVVNEIPNYSYVIPQKVTGSLTAFISKYGFVSADVHYVDYSQGVYSSNNGAFADGNEVTLEDELQAAVNANVGAEARLGNLRVRGGYAFYQNPFRDVSDANNVGFTQDRAVITAGVGLRFDGFFLDAALNLENRNTIPLEYYGSGVVSNSNSKINMLRFTIGSNF